MTGIAQITLSRQELYEQLWSTPTVHVAKKYGISDVAINKICKKYNIPKPPLGYWARLQFGRKVTQTPLPPSATQTPITISKNAGKTQRRTSSVTLEQESKDRITVPNELSVPHPLIKKSKQALRSGHTDKYGRVGTHWESECLDIAVSKPSIDRGLRILNTLIKALEERGHSVSISNHPRKIASSKPWETLVTIGKEGIPIRLEEPADRSKHVPTEPEKKRGYFDPYDFAPSGRLILIIDSYAGDAKKRWTDTKKEPLEDRLSEVISALESTAEAEHIRTIQRREEEKRYQEARIAREKEESRIRNLDSLLSSWRSSQEIHSLVQEFELRLAQEVLPKESESSLREWIEWAKRRAIALNPIEQTIKSYSESPILDQE